MPGVSSHTDMSIQETNAGNVGFRLSPQQEYLLSRPGRPAVTRCVALLSGQVDEAALKSALERVVARHEILRTTFVRPAGMRIPQQVIEDDLAVGWASGEAESVDAVLAQAAAEPFDLEHGPVVRATVAALPGDVVAFALAVPSACARPDSVPARTRSPSPESRATSACQHASRRSASSTRERSAAAPRAASSLESSSTATWVSARSLRSDRPKSSGRVAARSSPSPSQYARPLAASASSPLSRSWRHSA